jgi:hypothetical protein
MLRNEAPRPTLIRYDPSFARSAAMDRLASMAVFKRTVELGSFAGAGGGTVHLHQRRIRA